jgi:hypothetical protein
MTTPSNHEQVVSKFAALLGTKGAQKESMSTALVSSDPRGGVSRELLLCLSKTLESHEVVCTLPSLDMRKIDEDPGANLLPKVGEHRQTGNMQSGGDAVPQMEASVLGVSNAADASAKAAQVEQRAAQSLGALSSWTKSSVAYAPTALSKNIADSFSSLVNSRVQAWTILLLRHSLTTGDSASRSRLLTMLSSIINVISAKTAFKTLALPKSAVGHAKEADVILPLLLEVDMQVSIQSKNDTVTLRAPGTISGKYTVLLSLTAFIQQLVLFGLCCFTICFLDQETSTTMVPDWDWSKSILDLTLGSCLTPWYNRLEWLFSKL